MKQDYFLTQYKRKTQNVFKDINIRSETVKLLEETIGSMPFDISLSDIYIFFFCYVSSGIAKLRIRQILQDIMTWFLQEVNGKEFLKD